MNQPLWIALCLGLLACTGCFTTGPEKTPPATVRAVQPPPPPVTVEMVTSANARQMAHLLNDEITRDGQGERLTPPSP